MWQRGDKERRKGRKRREGKGDGGERERESARLYRVVCSSYTYGYNITSASLQSDNICMQSFTSCPAPCSSSFMHFQFASEETVSTSSITVTESSSSPSSYSYSSTKRLSLLECSAYWKIAKTLNVKLHVVVTTPVQALTHCLSIPGLFNANLSPMGSRLSFFKIKFTNFWIFYDFILLVLYLLP